MNLREAAKMALEALLLSTPKPRPSDDDYAEQGWKEHKAAITALRAALSEDVPETNFGNMAKVVDSKESDHIAAANKMVATIRQEVTVEPVAYSYTDAKGRTVLVSTNTAPYEDAKPLYAAPPKRKPLTDEEMWDVIGSLADTRLAGPLEKLIRATERAHDIGGDK